MRLKDARSFWRIMKSISLREIEVEAARPFSLALVGAPARRLDALRRLYPDVPPETAHPLIRAFDSVGECDGFPQESGSFDVVIDAGGGWAPTGGRVSMFSVGELGGWDLMVERLLDERADLALTLARRFPGLREAVARRTIRETATANAEFAMLNALPGIVPVLGILLPTAIMGDLLMLAKNQALMLYRLAACHDLPLDARARARDVAPLVGNAFGWRALAREVVGFVPGGVGLVARGAIAYAGTMALGEAMHRFYEMGERPTRAAIGQLYKRRIGEARETASGILHRVRALPRPRGLLRGRREPGDA